MCIRLNIDCDYLLLFYPTHVFIGVYFPGIIISRSKLHVEHRLLFKVKTTTRMTRMHWLVFFHEKWNAFQRLYEKSRLSANRRETEYFLNIQLHALLRCGKITRNWRVSYCFLALLLLFRKGLLDWNWLCLFKNRKEARYCLSSTYTGEKWNCPDSAISHLTRPNCYQCALFGSTLFNWFSCNPK